MSVYLSLSGEIELTDSMKNPDCLIFGSKSEFRKTVSLKLYQKLMERLDLEPEDFKKYLSKKSLEKLYELRDNGVHSKLYFNRVIREDSMKIAGYLDYKIANTLHKNLMFSETVDLVEDPDRFCLHALNSFIFCLGLEIPGLEIKDLFIGYESESDFLYPANRIHLINKNFTEFAGSRQMIILSDMLRTESDFDMKRLRI